MAALVHSVFRRSEDHREMKLKGEAAEELHVPGVYVPAAASGV